jgi:hypothetical protein
MTSISPQLKRINANLEGGWVRRWERNIWEGTVSCGEQIVILILIRLATEILWAKSLPSKDNSLALKFDLFPTSRTEAHFHYHYCCGSGAFIQNVAGKLADRDYRPSILAPSEFETGLVIPFANFLPSVEFSFACLAKSDVIVRRHYVWGLKPRFLDSVESPWREILAKGRSGVTPWKAAA